MFTRLQTAIAFALSGSLGCTAVVGDDSHDAPDAGAINAPSGAPRQHHRPQPGPSLGEFIITYYWVALESEAPGEPDTHVYDDGCNQLAFVSNAFFARMRLEGTARLRDGRLLNYDGACACPTSPCFVELDERFPWGTGAMRRALVPLRSVAVDRDIITIGTRLYVEELDGLAMPAVGDAAAFVHDGCVSADDTGGAIGGMQIDFFAGLRQHYLDIIGRYPGDSVTLHRAGEVCPDA